MLLVGLCYHHIGRKEILWVIIFIISPLHSSVIIASHLNLHIEHFEDFIKLVASIFI